MTTEDSSPVHPNTEQSLQHEVSGKDMRPLPPQ